MKNFYIALCSIIYIFLFSHFVFADERQNISIDLNIKNQNSFKLDKVYFSDNELTKFSDFPTPYSLQIISLENKVIFEKYIFKDFFTSPNGKAQITIPTFYTGATIKLFYNKLVLITIDLINSFCISNDRVCYKYCALKAVDSDCFICGNGVCEKGESKIKCPVDCSVLKEKSSDNLVLPENIFIESDDANQNIELKSITKEKENLTLIFYISFIIGLLVLYFFSRQKKQLK